MGEYYSVQCSVFKGEVLVGAVYFQQLEPYTRPTLWSYILVAERLIILYFKHHFLYGHINLYNVQRITVGRRIVVNNQLLVSLLLATEVIEQIACDIKEPQDHRWQRPDDTYMMSCQTCADICDNGTKTAMTAFKSWLQAHEEAQVMLASVLVVVGVWWLVRTILALFINLLCPILVVLLAVVYVPQLRAPLLGQNYPVVASIMRNILLKLAETMSS